MDATHRTTMPLGQASQPQRSPAFVVLTLFALIASLVLLSGCGTQGSSKSTVAVPVTQAQSVQRKQVHRAPAPTFSTAVRIAQRHFYLFAPSNVGLMQPAVDAQGHVCVGEMHANRLGCLNAHTGVVTSWLPPDAQYGIMTT